MDKELIEGLSNLSNSLDKISEALSKKGEAKSASVTALQMGNFDKQIKEVSQSIIEVKKDTQKILDQQDTILKILKKEKDSKIDNKKEEKVKNIPQESTPVKVSKDKKVERDSKIDNKKEEKVKNIPQEPTPVKVSKDKKAEREEKDRDGGKKEKVKNIPQEPTPVKVSKDKKVEREEKDRDDGKVKKVSSGKPTTEEVSKKKEEKKPGFFGDMDTKKIKDGISAVLIIATGIIAIGLALKLVGKIDFLSVIGLALALPLIAIAFTKIAAAFSGQEVDDGKGKKIKTNKINLRDLPAVILGMVGFSTAIAASSWILSKVKPVGLFQAMTSILIAGTFAVLAPNLGKIIRAFSDVGLFNALKAAAFLPIVMLGVSTAIMLSSYVLSKVRPIGLFQAITSILIAGTFSVMSYGLGKLISAFKGINPITALLASALMPIVLVAVSVSIAISSYFLSKVKPIGLFQAFTAIMIAATFAVISFGIGKIISAFKGVNPVAALAASVIMPILFVALSVSIMISSYFLSKVRPIGLFQALSSIFIAATFVVLSYGVAKILKAFRGISPLEVGMAAISMPIIFTALSMAILASSYFLSKVKPIGFFQFLTSVGISLLFVVFSFTLKLIVDKLKNLKPKDVLKAGLMLIGWTTTVAIAGWIISKMPDVSIGKIIKFTLLSLALVGTAVVMALSIKYLSKVSLTDIVKGGLVIVAIATVISLSSLILNFGKYDKYPSLKWAIGVGLTMVAFGLAALTLGTIITATAGLGAIAIASGLIAVLAIAGTIVAVDKIISTGQYSKYPGLKWALGVGGTLVGFAAAVVTLGVINSVGGIASTLTFGVVKNPIDAGVEAVIKIAKLIPLVDRIISSGQYSKYPGVKWSLGVGGTLMAFGSAVVVLGALNSGGGLVQKLTLGLVKNPIDSGLSAIRKIAEAIVDVDRILSKGNFKKGPDIKWTASTGMILAIFTTAIGTLGVLSSGMGLLSKLTGAKSPLDSGVEAVKKLAQSVVDVDTILSKGKYSVGPNATWSKGISLALGAFSPIYGMLVKEKIMSLFGKGVSVKDFSEAIKTISQGIVDSANLFGKSNTSFKSGPPVAWADGVSKALGAFSPIYTLLLKNTGFFKSGVSPKQFADAIKTISQGIVDAANFFGSAKSSFQNGPPIAWADGVSKALGAFSPIYTLLLKNSGWFKSGVSPKQFAEAIRTISQGIVDSANFFGNAKSSFQNGPPVAWADGVSKALGAFSPIYVILLKNSGWFKSGVSPKQFAEAIKTISQGIVDSANLFGKSKASFQNGPPAIWAEGVGKALAVFSPIYTLLLNNSGWFKSGVSADKFAGAIRTISQGIVDSANIFSRAKASFLNSPPIKWAEGVGKALAVFSPIYTLLLNNSGWFKSGVSADKFAGAIRTISQGIVDSAKIFSKSKSAFSNYPSLKWSDGVSKSLQAFAPIFEYLNKNKSFLGSLFGSDPSKDLNKAIVGIADTIVSVSFKLSKGKFGNYIPDEFIKGLDRTYNFVSGLSSKIKDLKIKKIEDNLIKIADLIRIVSLKLSTINFKNVITDSFIKGIDKSIDLIINGIKKTKNLKLEDTFKLFIISSSISNLSNSFSKANFNKYPTTKWLNSTYNSIVKFNQLISTLSKNVSSGVLTLKNITDTILWVDKKLATGKYSKWPIDVWLKKSINSIKTYGDMIIKSDKSYPFRNLASGILKDKMIVEFLLWVDKKLETGKYKKWPDKPWIPKSIDSILKYGRLAIQSDKEFSWKNLISGFLKVRLITNTILWVDKTLDKGRYKKWPEKLWIDKTSTSILRFGQLAIDVDKKFGMVKLFLGLMKAKSISNAIKDISLNLDKGKYTKFPSLEWAKGVPIAIASFMTLPFKGVLGQVADFILGPSEDSKKSQLAKVVDMMLFVDKKLQSGNWKKFPTVNWVNGTILAIQKFRQMVSLLSFSSLGDKITQAFGFKNPIVSALSNIEMLAVSFDKLAKSVKTFTESIKSIDAEKLSAIRGLSSNVIMMSLMDPAQFDSMMTKLEERSGVFADLLKDFDSKKSETSKSGGGGGVNFKPASEAKNQKTDSQILGEKMDLMNALLSDISSVVGSRGALKNYLNKMKDDITIGGSSNSLNQRSDSRLKNIVKKLYVSDSGINVYLFSYKFDPSTLYQGVIAQELLNTPYESALHMDKNGLYSVDYSQIDVDFKKTNFV